MVNTHRSKAGRTRTAPAFFTYARLGESGGYLLSNKKAKVKAPVVAPPVAVISKKSARKGKGLRRADTVHVYEGQPQTKTKPAAWVPKAAKKSAKKSVKKKAPKKKQPVKKKPVKKKATVKKPPVKKKAITKKKPAVAAAAKKKTLKRSPTITRADDIAIIAQEQLMSVTNPSGQAHSYTDCSVFREDGVVFEAQLSQIDIATNVDKFFNAQIVSGNAGPDVAYHVCTSWGRTGTKGQTQVQGPFFDSALGDGKAKAMVAFEAKFKSKSGVNFAQRETYIPGNGKYAFKMVDYGRVQVGDVMWQYYVDNGVDGKKTAWYDYLSDASCEVDGTWIEWQNNPSLIVRCISSGHWTYRVDFRSMTQANTSTGTQRQIRRTVDGKPC